MNFSGLSGCRRITKYVFPLWNLLSLNSFRQNSFLVFFALRKVFRLSGVFLPKYSFYNVFVKTKNSLVSIFLFFFSRKKPELPLCFSLEKFCVRVFFPLKNLYSERCFPLKKIFCFLFAIRMSEPIGLTLFIFFARARAYACIICLANTKSTDFFKNISTTLFSSIETART